MCAACSAPRLDTSPAWRAPVTRCWRSVFSPEPGLFEIVDELDAAQPLGACFHLHTPLAARHDGPCWVLAGDGLRVVIEPEWAVASAGFAQEDMGIGKYGTAYGHLQLRVAPARRHRLLTRIRIQRQR